jgi:hypothetical protein
MSLIGYNVEFKNDSDTSESKILIGYVIDKVRVYSSQGGNKDCFMINTKEGMKIVSPYYIISTV